VYFSWMLAISPFICVSSERPMESTLPNIPNGLFAHLPPSQNHVEVVEDLLEAGVYVLKKIGLPIKGGRLNELVRRLLSFSGRRSEHRHRPNADPSRGFGGC